MLKVQNKRVSYFILPEMLNFWQKNKYTCRNISLFNLVLSYHYEVPQIHVHSMSVQ